jgi:rhodanese-related sulfurtransferase
MHSVSTDEVRARLISRQEVALLDLRDEVQFAAGHPLFAASMPLGRLELEILDRVPRPTTPVVVYDDGEGLAQKAIQRLAQLGYPDVACLQGGLSGWRVAGAELFSDVNVPSKAFGELVEVSRHTPSLTAEDLRDKLNHTEDLVVLDARRFEEYRTMSIPTATNVPGAELVYRVREIAPRPETLVVINCAGRTRSIIGTQSLLNAGVPNRVVALRNGTIGWLLAGLTLEHGQSRRFPDASRRNQSVATAGARAVADRAGVGRATSERVQSWAEDDSRTLYRFDVRTPEEFGAGHVPLFRSAPGGQLVQETDFFAPVRGARIVLVDDDGVRANMTGSWLAQMAWDVHVWDDAFGTAELKTGAWQPRIPAATPLAAPVANAYKRAYEGIDNPREAMQSYLEWEFGLVAQLERDGTHHFRVI